MHGEYKIPGGKLVVVDLEVVEDRLHAVQVSGDFFLEPDSALAAIDGALTGMPANASEAAVAAAVQRAMGDAIAYGITAEGVAVAVQRALTGGAA